MKYLFIGGSRDGELNAVASSHEWIRMPVRPTLDETLGNLHPIQLEYEEYRMFTIGGENTDFILYAISGMSPNQIINRLILGYRKP